MINKVTLVGRVGKEPEVKHLENDLTVANFSMATSESYKNKNGDKVENTEWHNIVLWRGLAKVAENYLKKGDLVYIEGKIRSRSYDDKDGVKCYVTEIYGDSMTMLSSKPKGNETKPAEEVNGGFDSFGSPSTMEDLPFN